MTHKDLDVWKKSFDLVVTVYKLTEELPRDEVYGLSSQMKLLILEKCFSN